MFKECKREESIAKVASRLSDGWLLDRHGRYGDAGLLWKKGVKGYIVPVWLMNELVLNGHVRWSHEIDSYVLKGFSP